MDIPHDSLPNQSILIQEFLMRFGLDFGVLFVLVMLIYYPRHHNKDFIFTLFLFNLVNFILCAILSSSQINMGFAFGLFAIFSIIRYRTVLIPVREMGYFFAVVALGVINALSTITTGEFPFLLAIANGVILLLTFALDRPIAFIKHETCQPVTYEKIELIRPENRQLLMADLRARTGLNVHRVEILQIDFFKDVAKLHVFYYSDKNETASAASGGGDVD